VAIDPESGSGNSSPTPAWQPADDGLSDPYVDLLDLVLHRFEQAVAFAMARPGLLAAVGAALVGALAGFLIGGRRRRRTPVAVVATPLRAAGRSARRASGPAARLGGRRNDRLAYYSDLANLAYRMWENPIIRALVVQAVVRRIGSLGR
jgi:hypothetical protein